jgi:large subunit ribosomal protein L4
MKVNLVDIQGKKVKDLDLPAEIFEAPVNVDLMHQAFIRQMANAHLGTHETKDRGDVSGGGKKPWRQKGTGRARQGSTRAAQWVGGGKIFTPHPRSYKQRMPKKMRRAALRSALSARASDNAMIFVETFNISEPKSKQFVQAIEKVAGKGSVLVVLPEKKSRENVFVSAKNVENVKVILANYLNIRDLLQYDRIVVDAGSLKVVESFLGA